MAAAAVTVACFLVLLIGYTGYSKQTKQLSAPQLLDVLLARKGILHSAVELNKVISLVALMLLGISQSSLFLKLLHCHITDILELSVGLVVAHSVFSSVYFGSQRSASNDLAMAKAAWQTIKQGPTRKRMDLLRAASIVLGAISSALLLAALGSLLLGWLFLQLAAWVAVLHFWTMEVDFKMQLQVRPAAYIVLLPYAAVLLEQALSWF